MNHFKALQLSNSGSAPEIICWYKPYMLADHYICSSNAIEIDWSSCQHPAALYRPPWTVISLSRTARWYSPLQFQELWILFDPFVACPLLPTGVLRLGATLPIHLWQVVQRRFVPTAEWWHFFSCSKVHGKGQSLVRSLISLLHTEPSLRSRLFHSKTLILQLLSPNSFSLNALLVL